MEMKSTPQLPTDHRGKYLSLVRGEYTETATKSQRPLQQMPRERCAEQIMASNIRRWS